MQGGVIMAVEMRKLKVDNNFYDLVSLEDYSSNPDMYDDKHTAIIDETNNVALPVLTKTDTESIGIRYGGLVSAVKLPETQEDRDKYSIEGNQENLFDMSHPESYKEVIETSQKLRDAERDILLTVENQTRAIVGEDDSPAMQGLKEAVNAKECDINSYAYRFGSNYSNDRRILSEEDISLKKLVKYGDSMDIAIDITFRDKSPEVPNPMGKVITKTITSDRIGGISDE